MNKREIGTRILADHIKMKQEATIDIIADDRERKSNVTILLSENRYVNLTVQRLSVGDYRIDSRLVIERKTLNDFAISIIDGRLFKQTVRLANSSFNGVLILEGSSKEISRVGVTREAMQGALITVSLILGIPVLRAVDEEETAKLMIYMARQVSRIANVGIQRPGYRPKMKSKRQLYILQGLPGIGYEKAMRLLDAFGTIENVISASKRELQTVEGIGKKTAERIKWAVREEISSFGNTALD